MELGHSLDVTGMITERLGSRMSPGFLAPIAWVDIGVLTCPEAKTVVEG